MELSLDPVCWPRPRYPSRTYQPALPQAVPFPNPRRLASDKVQYSVPVTITSKYHRNIQYLERLWFDRAKEAVEQNGV